MKSDLVRQQAHQAIQRHLGHRLVRIGPLQQALTHRNFNVKNDERPEFVGDAILNYSIVKMLFDAFPKLAEGEFSRPRVNLANEHVLAEVALEMNTDNGLYPGAGELKGGGFRRSSVLADTMEAMFAAISLDASFAAVGEVARHLFAEHVKRVDSKDQGKDNKTVLQEALRAHHLPLPKYRIKGQVGGMKGSRFVVSCDLSKLGFICRAQGTNRKVVEQEVAAEVLIRLERQLPLKKNKR